MRLCGAMMIQDGGVNLLWLLLLFMLHAEGKAYSLPGKPTLTSCRSPEKETFTCWWEPGSDGGLPTTYALYYRKENSDKVYECPDYHTAGNNSCFFNKNDTSIWINYNITVVATNAAGSTFSDPVDIDVVYIVKPNPPEKVATTLLDDKGWPFLRVTWEPPDKVDTGSGWITLIYEIRIKPKGDENWEMHHAGQQKGFNIFSLLPGVTYVLQVRCRPNHGFWSEWSSSSYIKVPDYFQREKSVWVLIAVFSAFILLILTWLIHMNSHNLKHWILPPVPGPKIKGFDKQLLKNGNSEDAFSSLGVSDFSPPTSSNFEDFLVEYLEVYVPKERELMLEESKDLHDSCLKSETSVSDSDSGRGSCDSHTLLMDKCDDAKEEGWQTDQQGTQMEMDVQRNEQSLEEKMGAYGHEDIVSPDMSSGRVKTWPSVFSPLPRYSSGPLDPPSSIEMAKRHYFSDSLFPSSYLIQPGHSPTEDFQANYSDVSFSNKQPQLFHPQTKAQQQLQAHSDIDISNISHKAAPTGLRLPTLRSNEYVEVQRVNAEDMVLLHPVSSGHGKDFTDMYQEEDYSKVKRVDSDSVLLLVKEEEMDLCSYDNQQSRRAADSCYTASVFTTPQKPSACIHTTLPPMDERAVNGYVDTNTMFMLPTY